MATSRRNETWSVVPFHSHVERGAGLIVGEAGMIDQPVLAFAPPPWQCQPHWLCGLGISASWSTVATVQALFIGIIVLVWVTLYDYARAKNTNLVTPTEEKTLREFQLLYLPPFLLATFADWIQGPYQYKIYTQYGFDEQQIGRLYICGFGSSLLLGTAIAASADTYGRKANCLCYCVVYSLSCLTKNSSDYHILMVGRVLGGIATSILFATFEAWCVTAYRADLACSVIGARGLDTVFVNAVLLNGLVAILSSLFGEVVVQMNGNNLVAVFNCVPVLLLGCALLMSFSWGENYGQQQQQQQQQQEEGEGGVRAEQDASEGKTEGEEPLLAGSPSTPAEDSADDGAGVGLWLLNSGDSDTAPSAVAQGGAAPPVPVAENTADGSSCATGGGGGSSGGSSQRGLDFLGSSSSKQVVACGSGTAAGTGLIAFFSAAKHIWRERRLLFLGMMGAFVEATLYIFIFLWTPCLEHAAAASTVAAVEETAQHQQQAEAHRPHVHHGGADDHVLLAGSNAVPAAAMAVEPLRHGLIFGAFMTWNMCGAQLAKVLLSKRRGRSSSSWQLRLGPDALMFGLIICCGVTLSAPILAPERFGVRHHWHFDRRQRHHPQHHYQYHTALCCCNCCPRNCGA